MVGQEISVAEAQARARGAAPSREHLITLPRTSKKVTAAIDDARIAVESDHGAFNDGPLKKLANWVRKQANKS